MLVTASDPRAGAAGGRSRPASWPWQHDGALAWFTAAVSLVLAGNLWLSRRLWGDAFFDLYAGRYIAGHGLPHGNVFTAASHGAPWIDQQWLAHLIYYGAWLAGGYPALVAVSSALVTGGFAVLALTMLRRGVPPTRMFAWTIGAFAVSAGNTEVRAQSFGYLFLALTLWLVADDSQAPRLQRRTWLIIAVLVAWANTYGSVLLGAGLVVLYAGYRAVTALARRDGRAARAYALLGALATAAAAATPYGPAVVGYYRSFLASPLVARYDGQWQPPSLSSPLCWAFFAMAAATAIAVGVAWRRGVRPDPVLAVMVAVLLVLALRTYKDLAWFGLAGSLLASDTMVRAGGAEVAPLGTGFQRVVAGSMAALAALAAVALTVTPGRVFQALIPSRAIGAAAPALRADPQVRVLADDWTGSALLWLHPELLGRVGFDIRLEQYSAAELSAFFAFNRAAGPRWQRVMRGYDVVVVSRSRYRRVTAELAGLPGWRVVYSGSDGIALTRLAAR